MKSRKRITFGEPEVGNLTQNKNSQYLKKQISVIYLWQGFFFQKTRVLSLNRITFGDPERGNLTQNKNSQYLQKLAFVSIESFCFVGRAGFEPAKM
ncbi:MAG: hypothetical protein C0512_14690 [Flavobacterium sp.]|nr:hypothetical protein [Flavobacterium sp.]